MRYKIKKNSSRSDKNSLTHFSSKMVVREPVCDEPEDIRESRIKLEPNPCSVRSVTNRFDSLPTLPVPGV
jgi:hypothetical protein